MPINPRINPTASKNVKIGEAAISLGANKLGEELSKCLDVLKLAYDLPSDTGDKDMAMRRLYSNLCSVMGIPRE